MTCPKKKSAPLWCEWPLVLSTLHKRATTIRRVKWAQIGIAFRSGVWRHVADTLGAFLSLGFAGMQTALGGLYLIAAQKEYESHFAVQMKRLRPDTHYSWVSLASLSLATAMS